MSSLHYQSSRWLGPSRQIVQHPPPVARHRTGKHNRKSKCIVNIFGRSVANVKRCSLYILNSNIEFKEAKKSRAGANKAKNKENREETNRKRLMERVESVFAFECGRKSNSKVLTNHHLHWAKSLSAAFVLKKMAARQKSSSGELKWKLICNPPAKKKARITGIAQSDQNKGQIESNWKKQTKTPTQNGSSFKFHSANGVLV